MLNRLGQSLERLSANTKAATLFLFLLSCFFYIGLGGTHLFDWDEINFAESAREMIESGNYLRVQINYLPFWEKPPFFFWIQVLSMKVFGINEFAARFPNALLGFFYMWSLFLIGKRHFSSKFGMIWALIFGASLLPQVYFRSGIIDPLFNLFIFLSIYFMAVALKDKNRKNLVLIALVSGLFSGLSVITKGPVGFLLLGLTLFVYLVLDRFRSFPSIKLIFSFITGLALIVGIWLSLEVAQNGFDILGQFIAYQLDLFSKDVAGHAQPFYYHFVVVFFGCFPMSIIALPMLFSRKNKENPIDWIRWMQILFWAVLLLFSIVTTKIIHYSSMTYLPLSFLAAYQLHQFGLEKWLRTLLLIVGVLIALLFTAVPFYFIRKDLFIDSIKDPFAVMSLMDGPSFSYAHLFYGSLFLVFLLLAFYFIKRNRIIEFSLTAYIGITVSLSAIFLFFLPKVEATTQGHAVRFAQEVSKEDCYFDAIGFKSYIPYFYGKVPFPASDSTKTHDWLIDGEIDKDVYFLAKYDYLFLETRPSFKKVKEKGGYVLWKREASQ